MSAPGAMVDCPRCRRANAPHRVSCLYCGATMPSPSAPPPPVVRALPADLDQLVQRALTGRAKVSQVEAAFLAARESPSPAVTPGAPPPPERAAAPIDLFTQLSEQLLRARTAADRGEEAEARAALRQLIRLAEPHAEARSTAIAPSPAIPAPVVVALPAMRQAYVLVVEGRGEIARAPGLALALAVDNATARLIAAARCPKVALRGEDLGPLEEAARRVTELAGLGAAVVAREALRDALPPDPVLSFADQGLVDLGEGAPWLDPEAAPRGSASRARLGEVCLVVPGEIVVRRYRKPADRLRGTTLSTLQESGERRIFVVDLHGEEGIWRLCEGLTDLRGLSGVEAHAQRRSLKGLLERADALFPGARLLESRICVPAEPPARRPEEEGLGPQEVAGWPLWEEHTRLCRVLARLPLGSGADGSLRAILRDQS